MADLALVLVMAVWGSSFAILRFFFTGGGGDPREAVSPLLLLAARMGVASSLLVLFLLATRDGRVALRGLLAPAARRSGGVVRDGALCGLLLAGGFLLQTEGLTITTASRSGFFTGVLVVFVPLLEFLLFRKRPAPSALVALLLSLSGMALLGGLFGAAGAVQATLRGDLLTLGCAVIFAGHIVLLGRVTGRHPVLLLLLLQLVVVGLVAALVGPLVEASRLPADGRLWAAIVYLALFATLLAFGVQTWGQRHITPVRVALSSSLEQAFAALWAFLFLGEKLTRREAAGGALIVLAVVVAEAGAALLSRRARPEATSSADP